MKQYHVKRKIAALLCISMLCGQAVPVVPALQSAAFAEEGGETTQKVFSGASASGHNASYDTSSDGSISGSASFSGSTVVAKLYKDGSKVDERTLPDGGGSFTFSGLSAGSYAVKYFFWGEGDRALETNSVTVGYSAVETPEETETPAPDPQPEETETPAPDPQPEETETPAPGATQQSSASTNSGSNKTQQTFNLTRNAPQSAITSYTCSKTDETKPGENDGTISGKVEFTGDATPIIIKLYTEDGSPVGEDAIETSGGSYSFNGLPAGKYKVDFHLFRQSASESEIVTIKPGAVEAKITGYSCHETHETAAGKEDGQLNGRVEFVGDLTVIVKLYDEGSSTSKREAAITSSGETYSFSDLKPGAYQVDFHLFGHEASYSVKATINAGAVPQAIRDYTCLKTDETAAGKADGTVSGSVTFSGSGPVKVALKTSNYTVATYSVAESGKTYAFDKLPAGTYSVEFTLPNDADTKSQTIEIGTATKPTSGQITGYTCEKTDETEAGKGDGKIRGTVAFSAAKEEDIVIVKLLAEDGTYLTEAVIRTSGEAFEFTGLSAGKYQVAFHMFNQSASDTRTIEIMATPAAAKIVSYVCLYTDLTAKDKNNGTITGSVTFTGSDPVIVKLYEEGSTASREEAVVSDSGDSYAFSNLPAGKYRVDFHLFGQSASETRTVEIGVAAPAVAPITITEVKEGENRLAVKGTAQPGSQILVQAEPAGAKAEVLVVGSDGKFETALSANPATYTKVSIYYVSDYSSAVSKTGSWTVKAPAGPPDITVDPIDNYSTTVVVKTGANLAVTLRTSDSTQTLESNADGLVHFSLTHKYLKGEEFIITVVYGSGSGKTVTKKVTVGNAADHKDLEYGDYGEAVLRLTTRLNQLGYPIAPTKDYNSAVREAVRLFQIANGQEADGEAGDRMQSALFSVSAIRFGSGRYPTLVRGDKGLALIKTLQQRLKDLGYYTIKVDGIFGSGTQRAVRLFQQVNGLKDTGIADNATQVLLYSSAAKPLGYVPAGGYSTLQRSSKYKSAVVTLQRRLRELGYYTGSIDGYFGSKTYRAVRNFQSRNGLKVNGIADALTQQVLYSAAAKKYNGTTAGSSSSSGYRLLYWGCRGDEVVRLQNALINAGYKNYVRSADGVFGQWTYDAVCAFQRDHGLTVDGIAGKKTQNLLYGTHY